MAITTSMCVSFKAELMEGGHCFNATVTPTGTATSGSTSVTNITAGSMSGIAVGMAVTGTSIPANAVVAAITGPQAITLSAAATAAISGGTLTIAGDTFKMALIKASPTGTYTYTNVNYTDITAEETSGTGYTAAGQAMTNISATTGSTTAFVSFGTPVSWTSATFSTAGCMIYNSSVRIGGTSGANTTGAGRAVSVHDFGGNQQVSTGTFSVIMPTASSSAAILRLA